MAAGHVEAERPDPRLRLTGVDEVHAAAVGAPAEPVGLGHLVEHGGDGAVRVQAVQGPGPRPDVLGHRARPEPPRRVARTIVEPGVRAEPGRPYGTLFELPVPACQPEA